MVAARAGGTGMGVLPHLLDRPGVPRHDAYLFFDLAEEAVVVAGRFLRDPAAAR